MLRRILLCRLFIDPLSEKILIHFITLYQNDCVDQQVAVVFLHYSSLKYLSYWPKFFSYILLWLGLILFLCFSLTLFQNQRSSHFEKNSNITIEKTYWRNILNLLVDLGQKVYILSGTIIPGFNNWPDKLFYEMKQKSKFPRTFIWKGYANHNLRKFY